MSKIIIGIDPDSKAHGIAVYYDGKLEFLVSVSLMDFITLLRSHVIQKSIETGWGIEAHIENVKGNNSVFMKPQKMTQKLLGEAKARGRTLGMCQQSQSEIERVIAHFMIPMKKHKISKMWKKDKAQFEKVTGWTGRSNEDTRSAAYFGFLGLK